MGDTYNEDTDIVQVNLTWGLGRNNDEMKIYKIMNEKGELYVKNFIIYEINMDYYIISFGIVKMKKKSRRINI